MKTVSIISVNYNQPEITLEFLASVYRSVNTDTTEIIVVDNGSEPNKIEEWKISYPDVLFIRSELNIGFAAGNNIGIRQASGKYLFLVNNDTEINPELIPTLVQLLDTNPKVGIVSPKIRYFHHPELIQYAGFSPINWYTGRNKCIGQFEKDNGQYDNYTGETAYIHGAAMLLRKEVIDSAGLMPEDYFLYYEEMDWCEQIRKAGYQIWIEPKALIYHKESASVGKLSPLKEYYMTRNRILFVRRNASPFASVVFKIYYCLVVVPKTTVLHFLAFRLNLLKAFYQGLITGLLADKFHKK